MTLRLLQADFVHRCLIRLLVLGGHLLGALGLHGAAILGSSFAGHMVRFADLETVD